MLKNEMVFFNPDGQQINQTEINAVTKKTVRGGELIQYSFDVADENMADDYYNKIYLQIAPALIGEEFDITKATGLVVCYFCNIQVPERTTRIALLQPQERSKSPTTAKEISQFRPM